MTYADRVSYAGLAAGGWGVTLACGHFHLVGKGKVQECDAMCENQVPVRCYKCGEPEG